MQMKNASNPFLLILFVITACNVSEKKNAAQKQSDISVSPAAPTPIPSTVSPSITPIISPVFIPSQAKTAQKANTSLPSNPESVAENKEILENSLIQAAKKDPILFWKDREIAEFYRKNEKKSEYFVLTTDKDLTIQAKEGTQLTIPADAFVDEKGNAPTYPLTIEVKEFYSFTDMILNNLATTSGEMTLETGGMLYVQAIDKFQKNLAIKSGKEITIEMPTKNKKERMELFYGQRSALTGAMNWRVANTQTKAVNWDNFWQGKPTEKGQDCVKNYDLGEIQFTVTEQKGLMGEERGQRLRIAKVPRTLVKKRYDMEDKLNCQYQHRIGYRKCYGNGTKENQAWLGTNMYMDWDKATLVSESKDVFNQKVSRYKTKILASIYQKNYVLHNKKDYYNGGFDSLKWRKDLAFYNKNYTFLSESGEEKKIKLDDLRNQKEDKNAKISSELGNAAANYVLRTKQLGWLNCDRFRNDGNEPLIVKAGGTQNLNFMVLIPSQRSVITGYLINDAFTFNGLSKNEKLKLVGVRYEKGEAEFAVVEVVAGEKYKMEDVPFVSMSYNELEKLLDL